MTRFILKDFVYLYTDGASRGNPGPSSCAFVVRDKNHELFLKDSKCIGITTCNVAEYKALIFGLEALLKFPFRGRVIVRSDSMLMVKQMMGKWKIKSKRIADEEYNARKLLESFESYNFKHIPRRYNKEADQLCNEALDNEVMDIENDICAFDPVQIDLTTPRKIVIKRTNPCIKTYDEVTLE